MARKVVILARKAGLRLELEAVEVQSLVPEPLRAAQSAAEFLDGLPQVCLRAVSASGAPWGSSRGLELQATAVQSLAAEPLTAGESAAVFLIGLLCGEVHQSNFIGN